MSLVDQAPATVPPTVAGAGPTFAHLNDRELLELVAGQLGELLAHVATLAGAAGQVTAMLEGGGMGGLLGSLMGGRRG
jgi:hypothetical protein